MEPRAAVPRARRRRRATFTCALARQRRPSHPCAGRRARLAAVATIVWFSTVGTRARATLPRRAARRGLDLPQRRPRRRHLRQSRRDPRGDAGAGQPGVADVPQPDPHLHPPARPDRGTAVESIGWSSRSRQASVTELRDSYGRSGPASSSSRTASTSSGSGPRRPRSDGTRGRRCGSTMRSGSRSSSATSSHRKGLRSRSRVCAPRPTVLLLVVGGDVKSTSRRPAQAEQPGRRRASAVRRSAATTTSRCSSRHPTCSSCPAHTRRMRSSCSRARERAAGGRDARGVRPGDRRGRRQRLPRRAGRRGDGRADGAARRLEEADLAGFRRRARASVEAYSWRAIAKRYLELAAGLLAEREKGAHT